MECRVYESAEQTTKYLVLKTKHRPTIGIICGSGLGGLADNVEDMDQFNFSDIPGFPLSTGIDLKKHQLNELLYFKIIVYILQT